jgi:uncharacterized DUF497 family protein
MERILVSLREASQTQIQPQKNQGEKTDYKDTEQAWYDIEEGNQKDDVTVIDVTDKGQVAFKWTREKSNQNITDIRTGKQGFSFYLARYVFRDTFLIEDDVLATKDDLTGVIGRAHKKDKEMIVINAVKEAENLIRIVSAYYADDPKYELFVNKYKERVKRGIGNKPKKEGPKKVYSILAGSMPESLEKRLRDVLRERKMKISFKD